MTDISGPGSTIYAAATPPGIGGVAVVRVSGPGAHQGLKVLLGAQGTLPRPRQTGLRRLTDPLSGLQIDQAMVILFAGPASYTGEDTVEYHVHGGLAVLQGLMAALSRLPGYRLALPGEFTRRAFENGKMDLTAAEAVADLIHAETDLQKQQALSQMGGALAALYEGWAERLTRALAYIEADLDFPDEDLPEGPIAAVRPVLDALIGDLTAHLDDKRRGERLRNGIQVAVIGAPNAGKSTLVNALAQREVAIVSPLAGTTRDVIEVHLNLGGYPVILADTAGLRPEQIGETGHDAIETEGIRRALRCAREADLKLLVLDSSAPADEATMALADDHSLIVWNKADGNRADYEASDELAISARDGTGMDRLLERLTERLAQLIGTREAPGLTRERHRVALTEALSELQQSLAAPLPELAAENLRLAVRALGRITGRVDVEDLLDIIFRDFCIGK